MQICGFVEALLKLLLKNKQPHEGAHQAPNALIAHVNAARTEFAVQMTDLHNKVDGMADLMSQAMERMSLTTARPAEMATSRATTRLDRRTDKHPYRKKLLVRLFLFLL